MSEYKKEITWKSWFAFSKELSELGDETLRCVDIVIYCYLWDEQDYYINELKRKEYRPSLPAIAKQTRNTEFIVRKSLKKLVELGLIAKLAEATSREGASYQVFDFQDIEGMLDGKSNKEEREEALEKRRVEQEKWKASQPVIEPISTVVEQIVEGLSSVECSSDPEPEPIVECPATDEQINAYCSIVGSDAEHVKEMLIGEPTAVQMIYEVLDNHAKELEEKAFFSTIASKADPHHKGTTPSNIDEDDMCPF